MRNFHEAETPALSSAEVCALRPRDDIEAWLTLFFNVWGASNPFDADGTLAAAITARTPREPDMNGSQRIMFNSLFTTHDGVSALDGNVWWGASSREHVAGLVSTEARGVWRAMSRVTFFSEMFRARAGNAGLEMMRDGVAQPLIPFFNELGAFLDGASSDNDWESWFAARFEKACMVCVSLTPP